MKIDILDIRYTGLIFGEKIDGYRELLVDSKINISYMKDYVLTKLELRVNRGFITDGASVPWLFRWILDDWYGDMEKNLAAIIHDILYIWLGAECDKSIVDFKEANALFKAILVHYEVESKRKIKLAYTAVSSCVGKRCAITTNKYDIHNMKYTNWDWV